MRVPPKLTAGARDSARERGKSDPIDAVAVARAAIKEGLDALPVAQLAGIELDIRLLVDHRQRLVAARTRLINDLRWHLHDLWPELEIPTGGLIAVRFPEWLASRLARSEQTARVRIARDELRRIRELTRTIDQLQAELAPLVTKAAPRLLAERGCGILIAAKLVGEIAGISRFSRSLEAEGQGRLCGPLGRPVRAWMLERRKALASMSRATAIASSAGSWLPE